MLTVSRTLMILCAVFLFEAGSSLAQQTLPVPDTQQPPVTFRLEVNYVEVDAVVTDENGDFVDDLTVDDFEVLEDGESQSVTAFSRIRIPVERPTRLLFSDRQIEEDVSTNRRPFDGRVFVLALDDLHTTPLQTSYVKRAATEFIEQYLGANDLVSVVFTSGRTDAAQGFTGNQRLLLESVDRFAGRAARSSVLTRSDTYYRRLSERPAFEPIGDELGFERSDNARSKYATLRTLSQWLGGVRGRRKAVIFFSQGIDYDIYDVNQPLALTVQAEVRRTIAMATQTNVSLYTVDPRGLATVGSDQIEVFGGIPDDRFSGTETGLRSDSLRDDLRLAQDSLRVLADETGGMAFINSNDLSSAFAEIIRDNSSYYVLGYYPTNERRDGKSRTIDVLVNRPGVTVRSRKEYLAPSGKAEKFNLLEAGRNTSKELREVMTSPLPDSGLGLSVAALPYLGNGENVSLSVIVEIDPAGLTFIERAGNFVDTVELSVTVLDSAGKIRGGESQTLELDLPPETHEVISRYGLKVLSRVDLKPGRYQVLVASRESGGGAVGSVHRYLDIPDFSEDAIQMSGLAIASAVASRTPSAKLDPMFEDVLPAMPTTQREFLRGDELYLYVDVYDNELKRPHSVDITTTVLDSEERVVFSTVDTRSHTELKGTRGGYGHVAKISTAEFPYGFYVLRTEAISRLDPGSPVFRESKFEVLNPQSASSSQ